MKLNKKILRKMILNEIKNITESQVYPGSGLSHGFDNYELAKKIYSAVSNNEPKQNLMALRKTGMKREAKLQFAFSQAKNTVEQEIIKQEIFLLNGALDQLDHHLEIYEYGRVYDEDSDMGIYGLSPKGYPLERRYRRYSAHMGHDTHRPDDSDKLYGLKPDDPRYL